MFWASCVQPVDLLMSYSSEDAPSVNCLNFQIWSGLWAMLSLLHALAMGEEVWPTLFRDKLSRTVAMRRRSPGPRAIEKVRRITTDATPWLIGTVDWGDRTYIRVSGKKRRPPS